MQDVDRIESDRVNNETDGTKNVLGAVHMRKILPSRRGNNSNEIPS